MNKSTIELNYRLDVEAGSNSLEEINNRSYRALVSLSRLSQSHPARRCEHRRVITGNEFVEVVQLTESVIDHQELYQLAQLLQQDCISVYYPDIGTGELIGPAAAKWGEFDIEKFERYKARLTRRPGQPLEAPKTEQERLDEMYARIRQVFPQALLDTFAKQQINMLNNMIHRVLIDEDIEDVTVPRLEGFLELITEHLWSPALTAAINSMQKPPN